MCPCSCIQVDTLLSIVNKIYHNDEIDDDDYDYIVYYYLLANIIFIIIICYNILYSMYV